MLPLELPTWPSLAHFKNDPCCYSFFLISGVPTAARIPASDPEANDGQLSLRPAPEKHQEERRQEIQE